MSNITINPTTGVGEVNLHEVTREFRHTNQNITDGVTTLKDQSTAHFIADIQQSFQVQLAVVTGNAANILAITQAASATALAAATNTASLMADGAATRALLVQQRLDDLRFAELRERGGRHECCAKPISTFGPALNTQVQM